MAIKHPLSFQCVPPIPSILSFDVSDESDIKKSIDIDGQTYSEGFTFVIKPQKSMGVRIMPRDWDVNTVQTTISEGNYKRYVFVFKCVHDFADICVCDVYEDCVFKFESEFSPLLIKDFFSGVTAGADILKLGYNKMPQIGQPCTCEIRQLMNGGCTCGGFKREQEFKDKLKDFQKLLK